MAMNNRDRLNKAFELLSEGLFDPVDDVMTALNGANWNLVMAQKDAVKHGDVPRPLNKNDVLVHLRAITENGREFNTILSRAQQAYASELRETRNRWAHMDTFSSEDTLRALSTMELLLEAVNAPDSAKDVRTLRDNLQRSVYETHTRKTSQRLSVSIDPTQGMKPWREVITPHRDVATGQYSAAEFAANLYQVAFDENIRIAGNPYGDPVEFFNRTYVTEGLKDLMQRAIRRLVGDGNASPVVNLQTNFGGGKTHSLLSLYHLFGDTPVNELSSDIQNLVSDMGFTTAWEPGKVKRVVIVGNYLNVAAPHEEPDGTQVHTIWGDLAWQLGGRQGYAMIKDNDIAGKPPADRLITLLQNYGPCLILIDEWVAYAKQLVGNNDLPAGTFDDQFAFAQTLTEAVAAVPHCMLVVSIPASDNGGAGNEIEVGGENGKQALESLQNVVRRKADQWRPSTKDESFEIVRKRLFEEPTADMQNQIALTARKFMDEYRAHAQSYPSFATSSDYESRIRASYPLHPELLDRLYEDWSSLDNFQRTRGVLTLVSSIIHELWASNDTSPLILPGNVPLDSESVNANLVQYLRDPWKPIIDADVSGPESTPARIDNDRAALGKRHLTQRIARTIFFGSAPRAKAQHPGIDEQAVRLGTTIPGDPDGNFGSALSMLEQRCTYFFDEEGRYRYGIHPSIGKTARDFAERLREDPATVHNEIARRLKDEGAAGKRGLFRRVVIAPQSSDSIPDVDEATLVIVHPQWVSGRNDGENTESKQWIRNAIDRQGSKQRTNRNMVMFLVADKSGLPLVEDAVRSYLGWKQVLDQEERLDLTKSQSQQARASMDVFSANIDERLRTTYIWCIYPFQPMPSQPYALSDMKIPDTGGDSMAKRVGTKLKDANELNPYLAPDAVGYDVLPQIRSAFHNGVISASQVWQYITQYPYMPRLVDREVFNQALDAASNTVMTEEDRFALANGRDAATGMFHNLIIPGVTPSSRVLHVTDSTLIVQWDVAMAAYEEEQRQTRIERGEPSNLETETERLTENEGFSSHSGNSGENQNQQHSEADSAKRVYLGNISIDPDYPSRSLSHINEHILEPLRFAGAEIQIDMHIRATNKQPFDPSIVRIIEDATTKLSGASSNFEEE